MYVPPPAPYQSPGPPPDWSRLGYGPPGWPLAAAPGPSGWSIAALVMALSSWAFLGPLMSVPGLVAGLIGRARDSRAGAGTGMAVVAIAVNAVNVVVVTAVLTLFLVAVPRFTKALCDDAGTVRSIATARQAAARIQAASVSHDAPPVVDGHLAAWVPRADHVTLDLDGSDVLVMADDSTGDGDAWSIGAVYRLPGDVVGGQPVDETGCTDMGAGQEEG